jgi:hypothetical protein
MLQQISWSEYFIFLGLGTVVYYGWWLFRYFPGLHKPGVEECAYEGDVAGGKASKNQNPFFDPCIYMYTRVYTGIHIYDTPKPASPNRTAKILCSRPLRTISRRCAPVDQRCRGKSCYLAPTCPFIPSNRPITSFNGTSCFLAVLGRK